MARTLSAQRRQWRYIVMLVLVVALFGGWSLFWHFAANKAEATIEGWRAREAKAGRIYACGSQTIGGYPQAAHVIGVDLPLVAQLRPGDTVRFQEVTLAEAHELALARERQIGMLHEGLAQKLR